MKGPGNLELDVLGKVRCSHFMRSVEIQDERSIVFFDKNEEELYMIRNWKKVWPKIEKGRSYINLGFKTDLEIKFMRMEIERGTFKTEEWKG